MSRSHYSGGRVDGVRGRRVDKDRATQVGRALEAAAAAEATCCARAGASAMAERRTAAAAAALEQCLDAFDDLGRWTTARARRRRRSQHRV